MHPRCALIIPSFEIRGANGAYKYWPVLSEVLQGTISEMVLSGNSQVDHYAFLIGNVGPNDWDICCHPNADTTSMV
jgi:hypothetical protein